MNLRVGTSGYSYKEWVGPFYPEGTKAADMLRRYAERLPAVEINNTFYRLPRKNVLQAWAEQVPEGFRFVLKASQRITHFKRLEAAEDETGYLIATAGALGDRLGALLFQMPPNLPKDLARLERFLQNLPGGTRAAFEFRHPSWRDDAVHEALRARDLALCLADQDDEPPPPLVATAGWGYLRLRRSTYSEDDLREWASRLRDLPWSEAYVFFKHEDEAAGPRMAARFRDLAGGTGESPA